VKLAATEIAKPRTRYVSAVDAKDYSEPQAIRELLGRQLASPVRWPETVRALTGPGVAQLIECGPGKVLTGLNRRIERRPDLQILSLDDVASLDAALGATHV
jgi:[acyl-carrier-protein] S-malonyltransferase